MNRKIKVQLLAWKRERSNRMLLTALKYFCEEAPKFHVAQASSLLVKVINRQ